MNFIKDILVLPFAMMAGLAMILFAIFITPIIIIGYFFGKAEIIKTENGIEVKYSNE